MFESLDDAATASFYIDDFVVQGESNSGGPAAGESLKNLTSIPLGVALATDGSASIFTSNQRAALVDKHFSQVSAENSMKMRYMYSGNNFSFTNADAFIHWAAQRNLSVHGHALVWHPDYQLPDWARSPNSNSFKQSYQSHISTVAGHFNGKLASWDVVNEALHDSGDSNGLSEAPDGYRRSVFYEQYGGPGYIDEAFRLARAADADAELYYNDFNTENGQAKTDNLVKLVKRLQDNNVPIDGVGFQMHVVNDWPSIATIRQSWQKIVELRPKLKIKITELDVRVNNIYDGNTSNDVLNCNNDQALARQKARYKEIVKAYFDVVPADQRGGITLWGIADPDSWFANLTRSDGVIVPGCPLLFDGNLQTKPAFDGVAEALHETN